MEIIIRKDGVDTVFFTVSELDIKIVEHYVADFLVWLNPGNDAGVLKGITDKIDTRRKELLFEAVAFLRAHNVEIPAIIDDIFNTFFSHPEYKTLPQRFEITRLAQLAEALRIREEQEAARLAAEEAQRIAEAEEMQRRINEAVAAALAAMEANSEEPA